MDDKLISYFKTMIDANRVRIAALLLEQPATAEEIASRLQLRLVDVSRHLAQFEKLELLTLNGDRYSLDPHTLEGISREVLAQLRPAVEAHSNDAEADDFDRKVIKNYSLPDGRLREIPLQSKKFLAVLRHVVQEFEPGVRYTEKQVNEALKRYHEDSATLRRGLVDHQMIFRDLNGASYWRA